MKYRINYYADRKITFNRIHIMDPRITGTKTVKANETMTEEYDMDNRSDPKFVVPWQLI